MHRPVLNGEMPNLLELVEACPLDPTEMLGIDLGTVSDGSTDLSGTVACADGPTPSACQDALEFSAGADGAGGLSACADGLEPVSDVRLKTDIEQVGTTVYGLPLYRFRYKTGSDRFEGVMAQDVLEVMPDAVVTGEDGHYRVNYSRLGIGMTQA